jgi:hypothetical protein
LDVSLYLLRLKRRYGVGGRKVQKKENCIGGTKILHTSVKEMHIQSEK